MASIKCGNCKGTHGSYDQVRQCYGNSGRFNATVELPRPPLAPSRSTTVWAKENQASATGRTAVISPNGAAAQPEGSVRVKLGRDAYAWTTVPDGRYAIEEDGEIKFFKVAHGKAESKWAGWVFIDAQASDDLWPIRSAARKLSILAAIGNDIAAAMALYGREIGKCGHCGRTLTSEWRLRGIGPVCAGKMGW